MNILFYIYMAKEVNSRKFDRYVDLYYCIK